MDRRYLLVVVMLLSGCTTNRALNRYTIRQASTFNEIIEQQILDNVALFRNDRSALPHFAIVSDGTTQIFDQGAVSPTAAWGIKGFTTATLGLSGTRNLNENWKMSPVLTAGRVRRLRCAFQFLFAYPRIEVVEKSYDGCIAYVVQVAGGDYACINCVQELVSVGLLPKPGCCDFKATNVAVAPFPVAPSAPTPMPTPMPDSGNTGMSPLERENPFKTVGMETAFCQNGPCKSLDKKGCYLGECPAGHWVFKTREPAQKYADDLYRAIRCNMPQGWFCVGDKHEAGHCSCMYGIDCETYIWVAPGGQDEFARFAMTILALATLDPAAEPASQTMNVVLKGAADGLDQAQAALQSLGAGAQSATQGLESSQRQQSEAENNARAAIAATLATIPEREANPNVPEPLIGIHNQILDAKSRGIGILAQPTINDNELLELKGIIDSLQLIDAVPVNADFKPRLHALLGSNRADGKARTAIDHLLLARLQAAATSQEIALALTKKSAELASSADEAIKRSKDDLDSASTSVSESRQDAFGRSGSMPLSRPVPGIEFQPSAAIP
jgi:hypothetical protein